jgi:hypothetical protein
VRSAWTLDDIILFVMLVGVLWFLLAGCASTPPNWNDPTKWEFWLIEGVIDGACIAVGCF